MDIHLEVGYREIGRFLHGARHHLYRIFLFLGVVCFEVILELDIRIEWIVVGREGLVRITYIERQLNLSLLGEESSGFERCTDR